MMIRYEISNLHTVYTLKKLKYFYQYCKRKNIDPLYYDIEKIKINYETGVEKSRNYRQFGLYRRL